MRKKEYLVLPVLIILLLVQLLPYVLTIQFGETVILKAELYDPRDVFRGDYIALNFEQERVVLDSIELSVTKLQSLYDEKLYATIVKREGDWVVVDLSEEKPEKGVFIDCTIDYIEEHAGLLHLDFGVERYYIEANTGKALEEAGQEDLLMAQMKVWRGDMVMTDLIIMSGQQ